MSLWLGPGLSFPQDMSSKVSGSQPFHLLQCKSTPELTRKGRKAFSAIRCFHTSRNESSVSQKGKVPLLCQQRSPAAALLRILPFILSEFRRKGRCKAEIPLAAGWERQHQTHSVLPQGLQTACGIADRLSAQSQSNQELQLLWKVPVCLNHSSVGCTVYSAPPVRHLALVNTSLTKATSTMARASPTGRSPVSQRSPALEQPAQHTLPTETSTQNPSSCAAWIKR